MRNTRFNHLRQIPISGFVGMLMGSCATALLYYVFKVWERKNINTDAFGYCDPFMAWVYICAIGVIMHYVHSWVNFRQQKNRKEHEDNSGDRIG